MSPIRRAVVAGMFYEATLDALKKQIESCFKHELGPGELPKTSTERLKISIGYVVPHAGYMYSGPIAAHAYYKIASEGIADTYIIIGPNHSGIGASVSLYPEGEWITPLGSVKIDSELVQEIVNNSRFASLDTHAHEQEHSVEVQIPFLQYITNKEFRIVAITMMYQVPEVAKDLANAIHKAVSKLGRDVVVLASTDLTHYEPHDIAVKKDRLVIDRVLNLDSEGLYRVVMGREISMCGVGPVMTLIEYAKLVGASRAELLKYATSGDVTGDKAWVVGYASIRIYR